jgi:hypothetical protein
MATTISITVASGMSFEMTFLRYGCLCWTFSLRQDRHRTSDLASEPSCSTHFGSEAFVLIR